MLWLSHDLRLSERSFSFLAQLLDADEAGRLKPEAINDGIIPSMRARPSPLLVMTSTAGDDDSVLLRDWRERRLDAIDSGTASSLCFLEWSMPARSHCSSGAAPA